jgi:hypothetical protein
VEYASHANEAEVMRMVVKQLLRGPLVSDCQKDARQRYGSIEPDTMPDSN